MLFNMPQVSNNFLFSCNAEMIILSFMLRKRGEALIECQRGEGELSKRKKNQGVPQKRGNR